MKKGGNISVKNLTIKYGDKVAINDVSIDLIEGKVTAFIGPSGCGKSTFLRAFNRMNDEIIGASMEGDISWMGKQILSDEIDPVLLRRAVSMVFQKPNVFPISIYENVAFGLRIQGENEPSNLDAAVKQSLVDAALWDEVKDRLYDDA